MVVIDHLNTIQSIYYKVLTALGNKPFESLHHKA